MPNITPTVKLTKAQLKKLLERVLLRETSTSTPLIRSEALRSPGGPPLPSSEIPVGETLPSAPEMSASSPLRPGYDFSNISPYLPEKEPLGSQIAQEILLGRRPKPPFTSTESLLQRSGWSTLRPIPKMLPAEEAILNKKYAPTEPSGFDPFAPEATQSAVQAYSGRLYKDPFSTLRRSVGPPIRPPETSQEPISLEEGSSDLDALLKGLNLSPRDVLLSRSYKFGPDQNVIPVDLPYERARKLALEGVKAEEAAGLIPDSWKSGIKPVTRIRGVRPGLDKDLIHGLALERLKWKNPITETEVKTSKIAEKALKENLPTGSPSPAKKEAITMGIQMAKLWQKIGGRRGTQGRWWKEALQASPIKSLIKDEREYFIHSGVKWQKNPTEFERKHPRETKYLKMHWKEHMEGKGE